ncbi:MAG: hypothetical protein WCW67_06790 [Candidatus Margulisiibacteriota bacterium]
MPIKKLAIFMMAALVSLPAFASQSTNYKLLPKIVDSGGKTSSSPAYIFSSKTGITNQAKITGSSYIFYPGFFFPAEITGAVNTPAIIRMEDKTAPVIEVTIAGSDSPLWSNDSIVAAPTFKIDLTDDIELDPDSVIVKIDGEIRVNANSLTENLDSDKPQGYKTSICLSCATSFTPGMHSLYIEAKDKSRNFGFKQYDGLQVAAPNAAPEMKTGSLVVSPTTYSPAAGGGVTVAFSVNNETDVALFVYGPGGRGTEWARKMRAKAGYNQIEFSGVSDLSGEPLANGIYVLKVIAGGKELGKQYLVVYGTK